MSVTFLQAKYAVQTAFKLGQVPNLVGYGGIGKTELMSEVAKETDRGLFVLTATMLQEGDLAMPFPDNGTGMFGNIWNKAVDLTNVVTLNKFTDSLEDLKVSQKDTTDKGVRFKLHTILTQANDWSKAHPDKECILFIDEWNRSMIGVQNELMNLVYQGEVQGIKMEPNIRVALAGNPSSTMDGFGESQYNVVAGDNAIMDRMITMVMQPDLNSWVDTYAKRKGEDGKPMVDWRVIDFLMNNQADGFFHTEFFNAQTSSNNKAFENANATPRSWKAVSDILTEFEDLKAQGFYAVLGETSANEDFASNILLNMVSGKVGNEIAEMFLTYLETETDMMTPEYVLKNGAEKVMDTFNSYSVPKQDTLMNNMLNYFLNKPKKLTRKNANIFGDLLEAMAVNAKDSVFPIISNITSNPVLQDSELMWEDETGNSKVLDIHLGLLDLMQDKAYNNYDLMGLGKK